jgi:CO/xanthine dehydrogenase FAD-binding subunit
MRGDPARLELIAAASLDEALTLLADEPGAWTPIAGGTELMVAHAAGRLVPRRFLSLGSVRELRFIRTDGIGDTAASFLSIGGGTTFGEIRRNALIASEFPLLAQAAGWIGAIANQNRATLAGNIVNGSPAADAPPALLVYDAEIELVSRHGSTRSTRRMPYADFHLGYKQNLLAADELVFALHLPRRFGNYLSYQRKVGTRNAMAITKVGLAVIAKMDDDRIEEIRIAAASLADRPIRLAKTEAALLGQRLSAEICTAARKALLEEAKPIDDIRSTALYRRSVAANLLDEFLAAIPSGLKAEQTA